MGSDQNRRHTCYNIFSPHWTCSSQGSEVELNIMPNIFLWVPHHDLLSLCIHARLYSLLFTDTVISLISWCLYLFFFLPFFFWKPLSLQECDQATSSPELFLRKFSELEWILPPHTPRAFAASCNVLTLDCFHFISFFFPSETVISPKAETVHSLS